MLDNYHVNEDGLIYQVRREPFTYDTEYVKHRYDTYGHLNGLMSHLRLGYIVGSIGHVPYSLIDIGYGNGAFLKACAGVVEHCYGYDVSGYPLPEHASWAEDWRTRPVDVITFFDVLEHFEDPYFLRDLQANYVVISVPWCHYVDDEWFANWKHRRPNEHLWFFNSSSMRNFANATGYTVRNMTHLEDAIRPSPNALPNILTVTLQKRWSHA